jgi:hypothetical protein
MDDPPKPFTGWGGIGAKVLKSNHFRETWQVALLSKMKGLSSVLRAGVRAALYMTGSTKQAVKSTGVEYCVQSREAQGFPCIATRAWYSKLRGLPEGSRMAIWMDGVTVEGGPG